MPVIILIANLSTTFNKINSCKIKYKKIYIGKESTGLNGLTAI